MSYVHVQDIVLSDIDEQFSQTGNEWSVGPGKYNNNWPNCVHVKACSHYKLTNTCTVSACVQVGT